jgi:hypothetical protein
MIATSAGKAIVLPGGQQLPSKNAALLAVRTATYPPWGRERSQKGAQGQIDVVDDEGSFGRHFNAAAVALENPGLKRAVPRRAQAEAIEPFKIDGVRPTGGWRDGHHAAAEPIEQAQRDRVFNSLVEPDAGVERTADNVGAPVIGTQADFRIM